MSLTPKDLKAAFERGENISALLRNHTGSETNSEDIIQTSYDLQAGSYVAMLEKDPQLDVGLTAHAHSVARQLAECGKIGSLLEAGVGEGTTLIGVVEGLPEVPAIVHGIDISWSRLKVARKWFQKHGGPAHAEFAVASITHLPYADNSFDVVLTNHAIEPNGGREKELLAELYRVCSRYLIVCEPAYELTTPEIQRRMDSHGYCRDLPRHARELGMNVLKHEALKDNLLAHNPTAVTAIAKIPQNQDAIPQFVCPAYHTPARLIDGFYYSEESMRAYPVLQGIPCLKKEHAIIASKFTD
ncbi:MAG TPA: class I SAM-dependent methyltransferase [Prosthecobacter sp.]|nr:class I SAM-dependent methyltransferase [Prosthecobacter sp.]